jgi:hypothetical protein
MAGRSSTLRPLNSLWVGHELGPLEQLCLLSGLAAGHRFRLYSYEPEKLRGVPSGVELRDAAEVMPRERMVPYAGSSSYALGSNFWRYEMLAKGLGYWVDLDVLFLRPLASDSEYVLGRELEGTINNAVLYAPPESPLVRDLVTMVHCEGCPEWFGPRKRLQYYLLKMRRPGVGVQDLPWGTFGPGLFTYLTKKHRLEDFISAPDVFYPVSWRNARALYGPAEALEKMLTERTVAIHLYNSQLRELAKSPPPAGSYLANAFQRFGLPQILQSRDTLHSVSRSRKGGRLQRA